MITVYVSVDSSGVHFTSVSPGFWVIRLGFLLGVCCFSIIYILKGRWLDKWVIWLLFGCGGLAANCF